MRNACGRLARCLCGRLDAGAVLVAVAMIAVLLPGCDDDEPFTASRQAVALDAQLDWQQARLIVVQDSNRYKTLDSFARESMAAMFGREHLPGLSPVASLLDWLFNREAYTDCPVIRIRERGLRQHLSTHLPDKDRRRIQRTGYMTPRELADRVVLERIRQLEPRFEMARAIGRVRNAQGIAFLLPRLLHIVPHPDAPIDAPWHTPMELTPNAALLSPARRSLPPEQIAEHFGVPVSGITPEQAVSVLGPWQRLREAWQAGRVADVQENLDRLAAVLPGLAGEGVYPRDAQRGAEVRYYAWGKFTWGYWLYFLGSLVAVWGLLTRWRTPWILAVMLLLVAVTLHGYGIGLRWYILGRIPVANMFESVVGAAWVGIVLALVLELVYRVRVFLLAAHVTGFFALLLANQVLPGQLTSMLGILDDINLRLHTTLIIAAYALIGVAGVIAIVYLVGHYGGVVRRLLVTGVAGAGDGDDIPGCRAPSWLGQMDWSHLIVLNMLFVMLFVGIILGAVWADYSWGRPWGWDPKEVFALNTWLVYAILLHVRHVVRSKGLWTAWLSLAGCAMMAFNWWVVNYFIVGLHSYA